MFLIIMHRQLVTFYSASLMHREALKRQGYESATCHSKKFPKLDTEPYKYC